MYDGFRTLWMSIIGCRRCPGHAYLIVMHLHVWKSSIAVSSHVLFHVLLCACGSAFGKGVCCFDATMGAAVRYNHALYVFSVLDENRAAIPVLYLITSALSHLPIFIALMWLRKVQPEFDPCAWMMDDSKAQQKAIRLLHQRGLIR